ncbi:MULTISPECIES: multidrug efflux SMR transporter [unclassified Crossiella]|uniref:DMT family transporter n=1 Tax=unclassified Crossiella TaxID=2620835 RepID=UPI001FFEBEAC|nr:MULTISPECIES: multidrug efflux SMR transporter [unclassified Crossiella]MCK2243034.1 multidrug efflux SMR transporter [Crossiella sp. S99.2]MCK2256911.1 multidrug efflux SMR transporter [Crossiella sp. S99.1]
MPWLLLAGAILAEITATLSLRASNGLSRLLPVIFVVLGYGIAFTLLAFALKQINVGIAYAIWSGVGTAGTAVVASLLFNEKLNAMAITGICVVVAGVMIMGFSGSATHS